MLKVKVYKNIARLRVTTRVLETRGESGSGVTWAGTERLLSHSTALLMTGSGPGFVMRQVSSDISTRAVTEAWPGLSSLQGFQTTSWALPLQTQTPLQFRPYFWFLL